MYSLYKKTKTERALEKKVSQAKQIQAQLTKRDQLSFASKSRITTTLKTASSELKNCKIQSVMHSGSIACIHPSANEFRQDSHLKNIYIRK